MLPLREVIPPLTARALDGRTVQTAGYKQKRNLVLAFLHAHCSRCEDFLRRLAARAAELAEQEAAALVLYSELPAGSLSQNLPPHLVLTTDLTGRSPRVYLGQEAFGPAGQQRLGVFVTDRYGELFAQWVGSDEDALPGTEDVVSWLRRIEVACEECGAYHWLAEGR